jgi:hypothetical protein
MRSGSRWDGNKMSVVSRWVGARDSRASVCFNQCATWARKCDHVQGVGSRASVAAGLLRAASVGLVWFSLDRNALTILWLLRNDSSYRCQWASIKGQNRTGGQIFPFSFSPSRGIACPGGALRPLVFLCPNPLPTGTPVRVVPWPNRAE